MSHDVTHNFLTRDTFSFVQSKQFRILTIKIIHQNGFLQIMLKTWQIMSGTLHLN